ncbi:MAG: hypothetical protein LUF02_00505 [Erysipelotrichaceae bacterium]|nr:hypothetical protein [Erysipelotrichaceae bacterium]
MRLQLNLNQYYEGLDDYQVNQLFGLFMDMKPRVDFLKERIEDHKTEDSFYVTLRAMTFSGFRVIDEFMESVGKDPIFYAIKQLDECHRDYGKVDIQLMLDK